MPQLARSNLQHWRWALLPALHYAEDTQLYVDRMLRLQSDPGFSSSHNNKFKEFASVLSPDVLIVNSNSTTIAQKAICQSQRQCQAIISCFTVFFLFPKHPMCSVQCGKC